jgi:hypothetical protein
MSWHRAVHQDFPRLSIGAEVYHADADVERASASNTSPSGHFFSTGVDKEDEMSESIAD